VREGKNGRFLKRKKGPTDLRVEGHKIKWQEISRTMREDEKNVNSAKSAGALNLATGGWGEEKGKGLQKKRARGPNPRESRKEV